MTKKEQLATIHARAKAQFDKIQSAVRDERQQCLEDRRFYSIAGAQWEGKLGEQFANKPKFEVNKIHLAVIRIINEYRNNRITVDFVSKDGSQNDELADTCDGLYRADEQDSGAEEAYDNAFEEAVGGGFGAFRLRACEEDEEDEENERQRIKIEPIFDADSCVFFDLDAKRQDKADANFCFVLTSMTHDAYKEEYGDDPASWNKDISNSEFDWCTPDIVYVAEYYVVEKVKEKQHIFVLIDGTEQRYMADELENDPSIQERLNATGAQELRIKTPYGTQTQYIPFTVSSTGYSAYYLAKFKSKTGIYPFELTDQDKQEIGQNTGFKVGVIINESPSYYGGILVNDIVTEVNGNQVNGVKGFVEIVDTLPIGIAHLKVYRNGKYLNKQININ